MSKNTIIKGTVILTAAGFLTRVIGFFYRIFLSNTLGAEQMGIYQLVFPIYSICFTLYASGIQTSISSLIAAESGRNRKKNQKRILKTGLCFSVCIAAILSFLLYIKADAAARIILIEPRCASSLRIMAVLFPFCGVTSCINGYYYGMKKTVVPATTQLLEQIIRVLSVYCISLYFGHGSLSVTCELAVLGIVLGEIASEIYNTISLFFPLHKPKKQYSESVQLGYGTISSKLLKLAIPLTSNRLLVSILNSFESILIPAMLKRSGLSSAEALSIYGILNGMALPFIMFPSAITNSVAVMLLPAVSEASAQGNKKLIKNTTSLSIKYSLILGVFCTGIFLIFGDTLGLTIYGNAKAGHFLRTLSWLCPFIYLSTTLGSILNGLGKAGLTFLHTVIGLMIRIAFIVLMVPKQGINGYLIGLLISQLTIAALDTFAVFRHVHFTFLASSWIAKPAVAVALFGFFTYKIYELLAGVTDINRFLLLLMSCLALCILYLIFLFLSKIISARELRAG